MDESYRYIKGKPFVDDSYFFIPIHKSQDYHAMGVYQNVCAKHSHWKYWNGTNILLFWKDRQRGNIIITIIILDKNPGVTADVNILLFLM